MAISLRTISFWSGPGQAGRPAASLNGRIRVAVPERQDSQLHAATHVELVEDGREVVLDGLLRDTGGQGDVAVAETAGHRRDDFPLAWTEAFAAHAPVDDHRY